jgi:hypothetical protein
VIGDILPPQVAVAEAFGDLPRVVLFPDEEAVISNAVDKRRNEFATARACARDALAKLGMPPVPIVPGLRGAPQWPPGVVGSITHCAGYRASAVARDRDVVTVGLDAEPHDDLPPGELTRFLPFRVLLEDQDRGRWDQGMIGTEIRVSWSPLRSSGAVRRRRAGL